MLLTLAYRLMRCLFGLLTVLVGSDLSKDAELLLLRHENQVLRRQLNGRRLRWDHAGPALAYSAAPAGEPPLVAGDLRPRLAPLPQA
jgi:hypothetical protein